MMSKYNVGDLVSIVDWKDPQHMCSIVKVYLFNTYEDDEQYYELYSDLYGEEIWREHQLVLRVEPNEILKEML